MSWSRPLTVLALAAIVTLTVTIYAPGLHGPYLLDDISNLEPIKRWLDGELGWRGVVFDNRSGMLGRILSMASFMLDAWRTGSMDSFTFKPTNLLIHLLCGLVLWALLRRVLPRDPNTSTSAAWLSLLLTAAWLWAPLQASTVLYVVQRMAQLAALFMLLALWLYMTARQQIEKGRGSGQILLWIGVPACTILAALAKENGVLALPMALVLELSLFAPSEGMRRPRSVQAFFTVTVILPAVIAASWLACHPGFITGSYVLRNFTLTERLLTEPRILWSYVQTQLLPVGPRMGIYHDNYPVSVDFLHPWTTLPALLAWLLLVGMAWRWRRQSPLFTAGVGLFLVGQAMESSFIALELYFEHRNYLPSVGILLAATGLVARLAHKYPATKEGTLRRAAYALMLTVPLAYAFATWVQAGSWSSGRLFYAMQETYNPTSPRLQSALTAQAMSAGNLDDALGHIAIGERYGPASEAMTATIWRFLAYCETHHPSPNELYVQFEERTHGVITNFAMIGWELLAQRVERGCPSIDLKRLTADAGTWLAHNPLPATSQNAWRTRYNLARMMAADGRIAEAASTNRQAWIDSGYNNGIGVFQFQLDATLGDVGACREVLAHLDRAAGGADYRLNAAVATFREALDHGQIRPP